MSVLMKGFAAVMLGVVLTACGGGGSGPSSAESATSAPTATVSNAATVEVLTGANQIGSGGDTVTITATVKDKNNVSVAAEPITFSSDSGTLTSAATVTDATGVATAVLSAGADKSNRSIVVSATSGTVKSSVSVSVSGTSLSFSGVTTVGLNKTASLTVKATDSKSVPIAGLNIAVTSPLGNGLSASTLTTDSQGNAALTYTASNAGSDALSFSGAGVTVASTITVSSADFAFVSPAANTLIAIGVAQPVSVQYLSGGVPQAGKSVLFAATAGIVSPLTAVLTDGNGIASATVVSTTSSPASVQATLLNPQGQNVAQATLPIQFVAVTPATVVLQASPTAIGPNSNGSTAQQSQLIATVRDANGNPVQNMGVNFTRLTDPSGGNLSQASAVTDSSGQASVQYIAGGLTTASNGVTLRASVASAPSVYGDAAMTVNQSALFIALGTSNVISNLPSDPSTYEKDWTVSVTDSNGAVVPNVNLTLRVLPVSYGKGVLVFNKSWGRSSSSSVECANEDLNYNGVLDPNEDANGDGLLWPGNVISVTPSTVKTDANGRAIVKLLYAESYVPWVTVTLQAQAVVSGTESTTRATFRVAGSADDFSDETVSPAGLYSPFGIASVCSNPN